MPRHRQDPPFIRYQLPQGLAGKHPAPPAPGEQGSKSKPKPVTTMAVGEESGAPPPGIVTTQALGEETAGHAFSGDSAGVEGGLPPACQLTPTPA
jgi:hypothetical protein